QVFHAATDALFAATNAFGLIARGALWVGWSRLVHRRRLRSGAARGKPRGSPLGWLVRAARLRRVYQKESERVLAGHLARRATAVEGRPAQVDGDAVRLARAALVLAPDGVHAAGEGQ